MAWTRRMYRENNCWSVLFFKAKTGEGTCATFLPAAVQWEAMTFFTESVMGQFFKVLEKEVKPIDLPLITTPTYNFLLAFIEAEWTGQVCAYVEQFAWILLAEAASEVKLLIPCSVLFLRILLLLTRSCLLIKAWSCCMLYWTTRLGIPSSCPASSPTCPPSSPLSYIAQKFYLKCSLR